MKDFRGNKIKIDDKVAYCTRAGSSMKLKEGTVAEVGDTYIILVQVLQNYSNKAIYLRNPAYVIVLDRAIGS